MCIVRDSMSCVYGKQNNHRTEKRRVATGQTAQRCKIMMLVEMLNGRRSLMLVKKALDALKYFIIKPYLRYHSGSHIFLSGEGGRRLHSACARVCCFYPGMAALIAASASAAVLFIPNKSSPMYLAYFWQRMRSTDPLYEHVIKIYYYETSMYVCECGWATIREAERAIEAFAQWMKEIYMRCDGDADDDDSLGRGWTIVPARTFLFYENEAKIFTVDFFTL